MTVREFLEQAHRLDNRINSDITQVSELREICFGISSPVLGDKVQGSRSANASFVVSLEKIMDAEKSIDDEIDRFIELKTQIKQTIDSVENINTRMVLYYRYVHDKTWKQIADELHVGNATVHRWHREALAAAILPDNPIII